MKPRGQSGSSDFPQTLHNHKLDLRGTRLKVRGSPLVIFLVAAVFANALPTEGPTQNWTITAVGGKYGLMERSYGPSFWNAETVVLFGPIHFAVPLPSVVFLGVIVILLSLVLTVLIRSNAYKKAAHKRQKHF